LRERFSYRFFGVGWTVNKSRSCTFRRIVIAPDVVITDDRIRSQTIRRFCAWTVKSGACSNCFSGPIIPLRCNLRRILLNGNSGCFVDLAWFQENNYGCPKTEQDAGNAKHGDRQQPELISKEVPSEDTSKKKRPRQTKQCMSQAVCGLAIRRCHILETRFSFRGCEREPYGSEEFFVVKRFGQEGRSSCVQCCGTNQRIVLSRKDDNARRRRNFAELRLNFQAAHLGHTDID